VTTTPNAIPDGANLRKTEPRFYTVEEAAQLLRVHPNTVYGLIQAGTLKAMQIGRRKIVPAWALEEMSRELAT
jgi:excisionase family DNA binding protein